MKRLVLLLVATALGASPAVAQMNMPSMKMPAAKAKAAPAKKKAKPSAGTKAKKAALAKKGAAKKPLATKSPAKKRAAEDMSNKRGMQMPPGQTMPGITPQGQTMPGMNMPTGQHAGHATAAAAEPSVAPPPPEALKGPQNAADTVYGTAAMQPSRAFLLTKEHGGMTAAKLLVDQLETRMSKGRNGYFVNGQGWYGGDIDKLWLKTEIEGAYGRKAERAEFQALWSHAIDPWFDLQAGVRLDAAPRARGRLAVGVQGLAPYWIETESTVFISTKGDVTARLDVARDIRITQKLILQPRAELNLALQNIPSERVGSGLSTAELGLRLRYAFVPNFAPYIGVGYNRAVGDTRRFREVNGEDAGGLELLAGLRAWF